MHGQRSAKANYQLVTVADYEPQARETARACFPMTRLMEGWLDLIGSFETSFRLKGTPGG
jgi:hypothetical protein